MGPLRRHDERGRDQQRGGDEEGDVEEEGAHCCVLFAALVPSPCVFGFGQLLFIWFRGERRSGFY